MNRREKILLDERVRFKVEPFQSSHCERSAVVSMEPLGIDSVILLDSDIKRVI